MLASVAHFGRPSLRRFSDSMFRASSVYVGTISTRHQVSRAPVSVRAVYIAVDLLFIGVVGCTSPVTQSRLQTHPQDITSPAITHTDDSLTHALPRTGSRAPSAGLESATAQPQTAAASKVVPASFENAPAPSAPSATDQLNPTRLTVEQALLYTLDNHPRLRARRQQVEVARSKLIAASLLPNPQLVINADAPVSQGGPAELNGRIMFTVPTNWKMERAEMAANAGIVEARWAIDSEAYALLLASADAALEVLYLQELIELEKQLTTLAEDAAKIQRDRGDLKGITATQVIEADINIAETELDRLSSEPQLEDARIRLSRALGFCQPELVSVEGSLQVQPTQDLPLNELLAEAERTRPELARAEAAIWKSRRDVAAAQANAVPNFQVGPRFRADLEDGGTDKVGLRFNTDLPWFDRKQGDIYKAVSEVRVNQALRDEVRLTSLHDVAEAFVQLRGIETVLGQYDERVLPLMARTEKLLQDAKELQALDPVAIYDDLRRLGDIKRKQLKLRYQHNLLRAHLELLLGRRLNGSAPPHDAPSGLPVAATNESSRT